MVLKPYCVLPYLYTLFERLLRALQRTNQFLDIIETEFLKKNKFPGLFNINLLFFQVSRSQVGDTVEQDYLTIYIMDIFTDICLYEPVYSEIDFIVSSVVF